MEPLNVDGSFGEGGGQILRTAVCLAVLTRRPVRVSNIRAGREQPGLRPQHLSAIRILGDLCGAKLEGDEIGSAAVTFFPGELRGGSMEVDLRTAASITLVLQAVVPAVSLAGSGLRLDLRGGTDVPWSPTLDYFSTVVREGFHRAGIDFVLSATRRGYYPAGGGRAVAEIGTCREASPIVATTPGRGGGATILSRCGKLPIHVAERQAAAARRVLLDRGIEVARVVATAEESDSPGSSVALVSTGAQTLLGADSLGARGKKAEEVGAEAAEAFASYREGGSCVDPYLADMLAPILCFAKGESKLLVPRVTPHLTTSLHVASLFTDFKTTFEERGKCTVVAIRPGGRRAED
ncbi:MAG TPA: RNA 3'-terminal phosphate cyclase [Nitrososphaerales archaeon]|nr:RNA 3'-terminal phosphate cyclase [Nitrososphaerales archaeon]